MVRLFALVCWLAMSGVSFAAQAPDKLVSILDQQRGLQSALASGKDFGFTARQLGVVRKAQVEVFRLTEGKSTLGELNINEQVRLENALERINTQFKGGDLDQLAKGEQEVCARIARSGTSIKSTVCGTQAEFEFRRQASRDALEKRRICVPPGCGL